MHITARAGTSAAVTESGTIDKLGSLNLFGLYSSIYSGAAYAWGCDTTGQLGVGADDEEVVSRPRRLVSKHLEGLRVLQVLIFKNYVASCDIIILKILYTR